MTRHGAGGRGGDADVDGENSTAEGDRGGDAVVGDGGRGGDASVDGDNAHGIGGRGGRGGIGPGGRGGHAYIARDQADLELLIQAAEQEDARSGGGHGGDGFAVADGASDVLVAGGQGGEANQPDGRGGRGGRSLFQPEVFEHLPSMYREAFRSPSWSHMRWPYFEPITEPGRGGDAADAPQYKARRIITEQFKQRYFSSKGLPRTEAWWDREVVPMKWLNDKIRDAGHRWQALIVDDEYEFADIPKDR